MNPTTIRSRPRQPLLEEGGGGFVYPTTFCACPMTRPRFLMPYICLGYFCIQCVKMRGDYSLHWYWWNCWPSLFLTFFPINLSNNCHLGNISLFHYIWLKMRAEITINQVYLPIFFLKQPRKWPLMCLYCCTSIFPSNWFLWFLYIVELVLVLNIQ
jgi:hypothetical protein